jgi:hypothetical protein
VLVLHIEMYRRLQELGLIPKPTQAQIKESRKHNKQLLKELGKKTGAYIVYKPSFMYMP